MAVAGLGWCTPPDYLQKYDDYGAPLPKHVDFILELQLNSYVTEQKLIVVVRGCESVMSIIICFLVPAARPLHSRGRPHLSHAPHVPPPFLLPS